VRRKRQAHERAPLRTGRRRRWDGIRTHRRNCGGRCRLAAQPGMAAAHPLAAGSRRRPNSPSVNETSKLWVLRSNQSREGTNRPNRLRIRVHQQAQAPSALTRVGPTSPLHWVLTKLTPRPGPALQGQNRRLSGSFWHSSCPIPTPTKQLEDPPRGRAGSSAMRELTAARCGDKRRIKRHCQTFASGWKPPAIRRRTARNQGNLGEPTLNRRLMQDVSK